MTPASSTQKILLPTRWQGHPLTELPSRAVVFGPGLALTIRVVLAEIDLSFTVLQEGVFAQVVLMVPITVLVPMAMRRPVPTFFRGGA